jgi:hypothetical protein
MRAEFARFGGGVGRLTGLDELEEPHLKPALLEEDDGGDDEADDEQEGAAPEDEEGEQGTNPTSTTLGRARGLGRRGWNPGRSWRGRFDPVGLAFPAVSGKCDSLRKRSRGISALSEVEPAALGRVLAGEAAREFGHFQASRRAAPETRTGSRA